MLVEDIKANPFAKVVDMIKSLLAKLKEEAAAEADHKAWCDKELKDNKHKRNKKTAQSEKLSAEIEDLTATIASQGKKIATLNKERQDLTKSMGEATTDRNAEKAENVATPRQELTLSSLHWWCCANSIRPSQLASSSRCLR